MKNTKISRPIIFVAVIAYIIFAFIIFSLPDNPNNSKDKWNYLNSSEGHFKILFPSHPQETLQNCESAKNCMTYTSTSTDGTQYTASFVEYNNTSYDTSQLNYNLINSVELASLNIGGQTISSTRTTIRGYPAIKGTIKKTFGGYMKIQTILIGHNLYVLSIYSKNNSFPYLNKYFDSFVKI